MLIKAAINGGRSKADHPAVPVTCIEQARAAVAALVAGAGAVHLHVRGADGAESLDAAAVRAIVEAVREAAPNAPLGVSTGAWIVAGSARLEVVSQWTVLPDFASVNFDEEGSTALAEMLLARGVGVEAGVCDASAAAELVRSGLAPQCLRILLEPREQDLAAALHTVGEIETVLDAAGATAPRLLHGVDATAWDLIDEAARRSYDTRVGFEDTLAMPDGSAARDNAALVAAALRRARR